MGRLGLEWLFRLILEPRRLWRRNVDSLVFLWLLARGVIRRLISPASQERAELVEAREGLRRPLRFVVVMERVKMVTVNVSLGGLCLEGPLGIAAGASVRGFIEIRGELYPFAGKASWSSAGGKLGQERTGIRFTEGPDGLFVRLAEGRMKPGRREPGR